MPALPWKQSAMADPEAGYLAVATELVLRRYRDIPAFLRLSRRIGQQVEGSGGAIGFAMQAHLRERRFRTVSVWRDQAAMLGFLRSEPHRSAMGTQSGFAPTATCRWEVTGATLPPVWEAVESRLAAAAR